MTDPHSDQGSQLPSDAPPPQQLAVGAAAAAALSSENVDRTAQNEPASDVGQTDQPESKPEASAYQGSYRPGQSAQSQSSYVTERLMFHISRNTDIL